jgi:pyridoxamine 5'-phosphate oxidase family protein
MVEVRGVEICGRAEAIADAEPPMPGFSREIIRIRPERVLTWGLPESSTRNLT